MKTLSSIMVAYSDRVVETTREDVYVNAYGVVYIALFDAVYTCIEYKAVVV